MGIPNFVFASDREYERTKEKIEKFFQDRIRHVLPCSADVYARLKSHRVVDNVVSPTIPFSWSLRELGVISDDDDDDEAVESTLCSVQSKDGSCWINYNCQGNIVLYDIFQTKFIRIHGVPALDSEISCIDCSRIGTHNGFYIIAGMVNGATVVFSVTLQGVMYQYHKVMPPRKDKCSKILDVYAGLLPDLAISFNIVDGLIVSDLSYDSDKIWHYQVPLNYPQGFFLDGDDSSSFRCFLNFPQVVIYHNFEIWVCHDILDNRHQLHDLDFMLKMDEYIQSVQESQGTFPKNLLLAETNQRVISISTTASNTAQLSNRYSDTHTVFHKNEWNRHNRMSYCIAARDNYVFVCEQHLYDTCLTIYEHSPLSKEWLFLGYTDIRSKFNVHTVLALTVLPTQDTQLLSILTNKFTVHTCTIVPLPSSSTSPNH